MSYTIDLNLLLYATDAASPQQEAAMSFLEARAQDPEILCLAWPTIMGYLRIATHPRIFRSPLTPDQARENVSALLDLPQCRTITEAPNFLDVYREATSSVRPRGNLVPDAHLVALMRLHDVRTIYTNDTDFRKFPSITVRNPLAD